MAVPGLAAGSSHTWSVPTQGGVDICKVLLFFFLCDIRRERSLSDI